MATNTLHRMPPIVPDGYYERELPGAAAALLLPKSYNSGATAMLPERRTRPTAAKVDISKLLIPLDEFMNRASAEIDWVWEGLIGLALLTVFAAAPKAGKSTLIGHLLKALINGEEFLGRKTVAPRNVILFSEEQATLRRRFNELQLGHAANCPLRINPTLPTWEEVLAVVEQVEPGSVVFLDTGSGFWPVEDENDSAPVRRAVNPLIKATQERPLAIVFVHHMKKERSPSIMDRIRGSNALIGAADVIVALDKPIDGQSRRRRLSIFGRLDEGVLTAELINGRYSLVDVGNPPWGSGPTAPANVAGAKREKPPGPKPEKLAHTMNWLSSVLKERGEIPAADVQQLAELEGISPSTLRRAKSKLPVRSDRVGRRYVWKVQDDQAA